ncbi:ATP-binding protein [Phytohabitans sp. ZYX-F-186]|uniref:histidine kinase n=1 Tax=Phytohabitans maris TaxID=3071409 RepID=A0ABU0ZFJ4_9ACTN|nr:ATP-binding protein [Phytohabitans sp. ZYX-F-186]MDQ7905102.1 ATP-binding protein [Phytohabitans sp. ZYX-F-186]
MLRTSPRRRPWRLSLARQFLLLQLGIVLLVVGAVAAVSVAQADARFRSGEGRQLRSVAETVAANATVRQELAEASVNFERLSAEAEAARSVSGASFVLIADSGGTLLTGLDRSRPVPLGVSTVRSGKSWVGVVGDALVAHVPVLDEGRELVGLVAVGQQYPTWPEQLADAATDLLTYLLLGAALGVLGSWLLARWVKRQTLGLEPREITGLVEQREAMLHGIREGVLGSDAADRVTLVNDEAIRLLDLPEDAVGRSLHTLTLEPRLLDVLTGEAAGADQIGLRAGRVLVLNRMPVMLRGRQVGAVTTLRDRTELTALQRELDLSRHTTDTLRAQAHEFTNRLHTIAGLIELGEFDEVTRYISRASRSLAKLTSDITSRVPDPALAALLIAKSSLASEQGIELRVSARSVLPEVDDALSADLVTVVGNLVDNAFDSVGAGGWVEVSAAVDGDDVVVVVRDSGPGIAAELAQEVFAQGYTTKVEHHGLGLALIHLVCVRRGGSVAVDGSTFTTRLPLATAVRS